MQKMQKKGRRTRGEQDTNGNREDESRIPSHPKLEQARGDSNPNQETSRKKIKVMHRSKRKCSDNIWKQIEKARNSNIARAQLIKY